MQERTGNSIWDTIAVRRDQWPGDYVYYYCPGCTTVVRIPKDDEPVCPECARAELKDIFAEMLERLLNAWGFYDLTRHEDGRWLFKHEPDSESYSLWATAVKALGTYGELRSLRLDEPWGPDEAVLEAWISEIDSHIDPSSGLLHGPVGDEADPGTIVSMDKYLSGGYSGVLQRLKGAGVVAPDLDTYHLAAGQMTNEDHLRSREAFLAYQQRERDHWRENPWGAGSWTWRVITNHREILDARGEDPDDDLVDFAHRWLDEFQNAETGAWGGEEAPHYRVVNGIFKVLTAYRQCGWPIRHKERIVDFVLSGADLHRGFIGEGCTVFDPMTVLLVIRDRGCRYRLQDVEETTARTFLTFLDNWDPGLGWYRAGNWNGKHNNAVPAYMARILLDPPADHEELS